MRIILHPKARLTSDNHTAGEQETSGTSQALTIGSADQGDRFLESDPALSLRLTVSMAYSAPPGSWVLGALSRVWARRECSPEAPSPSGVGQTSDSGWESHTWIPESSQEERA